MTQPPPNTPTPNDPEPFQEEYYFFYGTLMDRHLLARILQHPTRLDLRPARITGWRCLMWGEYPALIESVPEDKVTGMAYRVCSIRERERLVQYETAAYRVQGCTIYLEDGTCTSGKTFVWDGDVDVLREGDFDFRDWVLKEKDIEFQGKCFMFRDVDSIYLDSMAEARCE